MVSILLCSAAVRAFQADVLKVTDCAVCPVKSLHQFATANIDVYDSGLAVVVNVVGIVP